MSKDSKMPSEEILRNYGYNKEELQEYLKLLEERDKEDKAGSLDTDCCDDDCDCDHDHDCDCKEHDHDCLQSEDHNHKHNNGSKPKLVKMCVLEEGVPCCNCGACNMCDLDPNKVCDNCGKCLYHYNTDEKGFVHVPIDKIITGEGDDELQALLSAYGLDDEDDGEENK